MKKPYLFILIAQIAIFGACKEKEVAVIGDTVREEWVIDEEAWARLDSTLKSYVDMGQLAGVSALIYEQDKEVYFNTFGYADRNAKIPMSRNTIVQIYSMTKPITGTALMTLYDKGAFNLDDPVAQYASEFEELKVYAGENASGKPILVEP
jgi:CubicO group peptidase (beta-lactamase class C family)